MFGHLHTYEIFTLIALLFYIYKKQYKVCSSDLCSITNLQSCLDINYNFSLLFLIFSLSVPYHLQQFMEPLLEFKRVYCWVYMLSFYFLYFALIRQIFYKTWYFRIDFIMPTTTESVYWYIIYGMFHLPVVISGNIIKFDDVWLPREWDSGIFHRFFKILHKLVNSYPSR